MASVLWYSNTVSYSSPYNYVTISHSELSNNYVEQGFAAGLSISGFYILDNVF